MKSATEPRHWASLEETGILWGMRVMLLVYRLFGRPVFRMFLHPIVSYYFAVSAPARNASRDYLRRLGLYFPELGIRGSWWDSYRHFIAFGENLLDKIVVWLGKLDPQQIQFHNRQLLVDMLDQGRGAILLGAHIGNLELCRALADLRGYIRLNILVHTKHAEKFNRLLGSVERGAANIELIQVTELNPAVAIRLHEKIQRGEFLVLVGDRIPVTGGRTVRARFLGEEAEFPQGPYLLASLLQCPVYTLLSYPQGGRYHIYLDLFAESVRVPHRQPQRDAMLAELAQRFATHLEVHCRKAPLQWFNFYRFWDKPSATTQPGKGASA
ncbi:MAG: lipid biosynthesis acyltransferase [Proteobacteria bacterium]|nr:lipid biosynthesis acyltransferase [Pseudomonadota bacterium]